MTLRLLPGRSPREAAEELRRQEIEVGNVLTAGHTGQEVLDAYLLWAINAERMLRNHFAPPSISALIFTQRYWALQTSGSVNWPLVKSLVDAEIADQRERLKQEKALLDEAQTRWMRGRLVVPDSSAVIHGPKLWEWEPAADLGLRDMPVQIVLPMLVLDELDDLKENTKQHTRNRARQTLKWLAVNLGSSQSFLARKGYSTEGTEGLVVRGDVQVDVMLDGPGHTRLAIADDEIVDRAADLAALSGRDVTFITNDTGQGYRARLAGLDVSMVAEPIYDIDIQEASRQAAKAEKARKDAERRAGQEASRGNRPSVAEAQLLRTSDEQDD